LAFKGFRRGWFGESYRHYLAAKGVKSGGYFFPRPVKGGPQPEQLKKYWQEGEGAQVRERLAGRRVAKLWTKQDIAEALARSTDSPRDAQLRTIAEQRLQDVDLESRRKYDQLRMVEDELRAMIGRFEYSFQDAVTTPLQDPEAWKRRAEESERANAAQELLQRTRLLEDAYLYGDPEAAELYVSGGDPVLAVYELGPVVGELDPEVKAILEQETFDDSGARSYLDVLSKQGRYDQSAEGTKEGLRKHVVREIRTGKEIVSLGSNDRAVENALAEAPSEVVRSAIDVRQRHMRSVIDGDERRAIQLERLAKESVGAGFARALERRRKEGPGKDPFGGEGKTPSMYPGEGSAYWRLQGRNAGRKKFGGVGDPNLSKGD